MSGNDLIYFDVLINHNEWLSGHKNWVLCIAWSPDSGRLVSACKNGVILCWEASSGKQLGSAMVGHKQWVTDLTWQPYHDSKHSLSYCVYGRFNCILFNAFSTARWLTQILQIFLHKLVNRAIDCSVLLAKINLRIPGLTRSTVLSVHTFSNYLKFRHMARIQRLGIVEFVILSVHQTLFLCTMLILSYYMM